jgi:hypothetical protein
VGSNPTLSASSPILHASLRFRTILYVVELALLSRDGCSARSDQITIVFGV